MRHILLSLILIGCGQAPELSEKELAALPKDQAALPDTLSLGVGPEGDKSAGRELDLSIDGGVPNGRVAMFYSRGTIGAGPCFPFLGGECLDITGPNVDFFFLPDLDANGSVELPTNLPASIPAGDYVMQAVSIDANGAFVGSEPVEMTVQPFAADCPTAGPLEPNDDALTESTVVASGDVLPANTVCAQDRTDWYSIDLNIGDELIVNATFLDDEGDIDVYIFDTPPAANNPILMDGSFVERGFSASDNETVGVVANRTGTYHIGVRMFSDDGSVEGNTYDLAVSVANTLVLPPVALEYSTEFIAGGTARPDTDLVLLLQNRIMSIGANGLPVDGMTLSWDSPTGGSGDITFSNGGADFTGNAQFPGEGPIGYRGSLLSGVSLLSDPATYDATGTAGPSTFDSRTLELQIRNRFDIVSGSSLPADGTAVIWSGGAGGSGDITFADGGTTFSGRAQFPGQGPIGYFGTLQ